MQLRFQKWMVVFFIGVCCFAAAPVHAQDEWQLSSAFYLWMAGMDGTVSADDRSLEIDASIGDILSNLQFGVMGGLRAENHYWAITGDLVYTGLGATIDQPSSEVDVDLLIVAGDVGYKVRPAFEVLGGIRYVSVNNRIEFRGPLGIIREADKSWVDPVIGIRMTPRLSENWALLSRLDIGGFDVGSDFTWQFHAHGIRRITDSASIAFGYRILSIDYDDEDGSSEFGLDTVMHGPSAGLIYRF